jgi:hypothetical protein
MMPPSELSQANITRAAGTSGNASDQADATAAGPCRLSNRAFDRFWAMSARSPTPEQTPGGEEAGPHDRLRRGGMWEVSQRLRSWRRGGKPSIGVWPCVPVRHRFTCIDPGKPIGMRPQFGNGKLPTTGVSWLPPAGCAWLTPAQLAQMERRWVSAAWCPDSALATRRLRLASARHCTYRKRQPNPL